MALTTVVFGIRSMAFVGMTGRERFRRIRPLSLRCLFLLYNSDQSRFDPLNLTNTLLQADELGVRLEFVNRLPLWEAQPLYRHRKHVERIAGGIRAKTMEGCACIYALDVYIQFPNGLKSPDIAIFCREPTEEEQHSVSTLIPEAVIEVVSEGFEAKDSEISPPFYLSQGVKDIVVFDPTTLLVMHVKQNSTTHQVPPIEIELECGCGAEV